MAASECFVIPIQAPVDFSLDDLVWYICISMNDESDTRNPGGSHVKSKNVWGLYVNKKKKYERAIKCRTRLEGKSVSQTSSFSEDSSGCWWNGKSDLDVFPRKKSEDCLLYHLTAADEEL